MSSEDVFVHEKGMCESDSVGAGTRIWAHAHVMKKAVVGRGCNIGEGSFVESGAILGDFCTVKNGVSVWDLVVCEDYVFLGPDSCFTNDFLPRAAFKKDPATEFRSTMIREGASIGANATIICGVTIGRHAMVGAGAVVTRDVPDFGLVIGNPAKPIGFVGRYGNRLEFGDDDTARCEKTGDLYRLRAGVVTIETMGIAPTRK